MFLTNNDNHSKNCFFKVQIEEYFSVQAKYVGTCHGAGHVCLILTAGKVVKDIIFFDNLRFDEMKQFSI